MKLRASTPFSAAQAIMLMILQCDQTSTSAQLTKDAASQEADLQTLIDQKLITNTQGNLSLSPQGKETIAKIWSLHELTERLAFEGIPDDEKALFLQTLKKIQSNCAKQTPYES